MENEELHIRNRWSVCCWILAAVGSGLFSFLQWRDSSGVSLPVFTGWIWLVLCLTSVLSGVRELRTKQIIRTEDDAILIGYSVGKKPAKLEPVTSIDSDQISYHLYSKNHEFSIKVSRLPERFRIFFDAKCESFLKTD